MPMPRATTGCVARHAAACGHDAARHMHAMHIFRAGFHPHQNDLPPMADKFFGILRAENQMTGCRPRRCRHALGKDNALFAV